LVVVQNMAVVMMQKMFLYVVGMLTIRLVEGMCLELT